LWAPVGESEDTFAAAEVKHTEGFGDGTRGALSGGASGQYRFDLPADISGLVHLAVHGARANFAGVLRRDDVDSGRIGFYDAYPDPSARSQSALTTRSELGTRFDRTGDDGSAQGLGIWTTISTFRQRMNLTGYTQRSRENPEWAGRGDLIEQHNDTLAFGGNANYRTRRFQPAEWLRLGLEVGAEGDTHGIEQAQNLLQAPQNETWDRRVDATVRVSHAGVFVDGFAGTRWITLRGGLRADVLLFDIDDRLGNFIPAFQEPSHIVGFRRTAGGIAWGPRVTLESDPLPWLKLSASYGMGYRSPQARQLEEGESAPFATVHSYEGGVTFHEPESWSIALAAYETRLSYDLAFDATEGRLERVGPTTRTGGVAHMLLRAHPFGQQNELTLSTSGTFVHARLEDPPPPTPDNPTPPFRPGQLLPYVPPFVLRLDAGWRATLADAVWGKPLWLRAGYGLTFLSERPLPYSERAAPVTTMDAALALRRDFIEVGVEGFNLLNAEYADTEYSYVSNWSREQLPSLLPARHLSAGPPLSVLGTMTIYL
jgi:outer membrane receptor protein involved in Fe transport